MISRNCMLRCAKCVSANMRSLPQRSHVTRSSQLGNAAVGDPSSLRGRSPVARWSDRAQHSAAGVVKGVAASCPYCWHGVHNGRFPKGWDACPNRADWRPGYGTGGQGGMIPAPPPRDTGRQIWRRARHGRPGGMIPAPPPRDACCATAPGWGTGGRGGWVCAGGRPRRTDLGVDRGNRAGRANRCGSGGPLGEGTAAIGRHRSAA